MGIQQSTIGIQKQRNPDKRQNTEIHHKASWLKVFGKEKGIIQTIEKYESQNDKDRMLDLSELKVPKAFLR